MLHVTCTLTWNAVRATQGYVSSSTSPEGTLGAREHEVAHGRSRGWRARTRVHVLELRLRQPAPGRGCSKLRVPRAPAGLAKMQMLTGEVWAGAEVLSCQPAATDRSLGCSEGAGIAMASSCSSVRPPTTCKPSYCVGFHCCMIRDLQTVAASKIQPPTLTISHSF